MATIDDVNPTEGVTPNDSEAALINLHISSAKTDSATSGCGLGSCRPKWMQSCANIKLFTVVICILACINGSISASYLPSVITTIERRFEFGSSMTGLVVASYEVGATIAVIFVSYLGNQRHIPFIIGLGAILVGTGTCLFALPHFISSPYSLLISLEAKNASKDICHNPQSPESEKAFCNLDELRSGSELYVIIFVIAQSLIGIGSTPILTLGLSYIDNHVTKKKSPQYLAFVYASATLGPVLGFGCGAALMEVYVDFTTPSFLKLPITATDSQWVGAWWVGFLIFGLLTLVIAPPFFAFPKSLTIPETMPRKCSKYSVTPNGAEISLNDVDLCDDEGAVVGDVDSDTPSASAKKSKCTSIKQFPRALIKLLKNPVYMLLNAASVFEMMIVTGFVTFVPKYLETQFDLRPSQANLYTGALAIPGAALGILSSGVVLKRLKLTMRGALQFAVILSVLCLACFSLAFVFGCDNAQIAGITSPYHKSVDVVEKVKLFPHNLTNECNSECTCVDSIFSPVCGPNSVTYFSACHAGCLSINGTAEDCNCIASMAKSTVLPDVTGSRVITDRVTVGACQKDCQMLTPFMILILLISFLISGLKTPITMVTMRCVEEDLRSFSLGIQVVIVRTCSLLPAPIIFGNIIDTTCLWWKIECEQQKNCLIYNVESFRYKYSGICTILHVCGLLTFVITWYIIRRQERYQETQLSDTTSEEACSAPKFYMNKEGENSVDSLAYTESTVVDSIESPSTPPVS